MTIPSFLEVRLDPAISYGSRGGPGFLTTVFSADSGAEQRNIQWSAARCSYDISYGIKDISQMNAVLALFYNVYGKAVGFRFRDWSDYQLTDELIGTGAASPQTDWQITKTYTADSGTNKYIRDIKKPVSATVSVKVDDIPAVITTDYVIDYTTGIISFVSGHEPTNGQTVKVTCEFDVPVRFDIDQLPITQEEWDLETVDSIQLVELKL